MAGRRSELISFLKAAAEVERREARRLMGARGYWDEFGIRQGGLMAFVRRYWHVIEPGTPFVDGWPMGAVAEHLEAVTFGEITKLLINVPPGYSKSLLVNVFWPAWEWALGHSHYRYVSFSYSSHLTRRDNLRFLAILRSRAFREDWRPAFHLKKTGEENVSNDAYGWKFATSIGGVGTGERGDRILLDDPHNVKEAESDTVRKATTDWFREGMSNRLNDMEKSAIVIIMQRVHEADVSGVILDEGLDYVHLCIPHEFVWDRATGTDGEAIPNGLGWVDPRWLPDESECDGELAWEARFNAEVTASLRHTMGPVAYEGQYQQSPQVKGGGIIRREYWQLWESQDGKFPPFSYVLASLDSAFTEKEENDPSALTIWGVFEQDGHQRVMLVHAWRKRLKLNGFMDSKRPHESLVAYENRTRKDWGLVQWVAHSCRRYLVDQILIENKANGRDVHDELIRQYQHEPWGLTLIEPTKDKVSRAWAVMPAWTQGLIYAPDREWADMVISEAASFPKGRYKDLTDSSTQAVRFLRIAGIIQSDQEVAAGEKKAVRHHSRPKSLAAHYQGM